MTQHEKDLKTKQAEARAAYKAAKDAWWATVTPEGLKDRSIYKSKAWRNVKEAEAACVALGVRI